MSTKIVAARLATSAGVTTVITRSSRPGSILKIVRYLQAHKKSPRSGTPSNDTEDTPTRSTSSLKLDNVEAPPLHTRFLPSVVPIRDRHFWILYGLKPHGILYIDIGAHKALVGKAGLLPAGVVEVEGNFAQQEAVRLIVVEKRRSPGPDGKMWEGTPHEVGRVLVNYASPEIARIKGHKSVDIKDLLGYADSDYIAERENISLFRLESRPATPIRESRVDISGITAYESNA
jgi:glutamate 5-kinase